MAEQNEGMAYYHLPGLFEFYDFYKVFLPLFREHREYFYDWCNIGSIYGSPSDCLWNGGRAASGNAKAEDVLSLVKDYGISARLTFSNSLLNEMHLSDRKCNSLCRLFSQSRGIPNGVIVHSEILTKHLLQNYPDLYLVSSTTKVLTDFSDLIKELNRDEFRFVVPDFRLNRRFESLSLLTREQKNKIEFLCNECCPIGCKDRKACYENVSRRNLGMTDQEHVCRSPEAGKGYRFSKAMENPAFIGTTDIEKCYRPMEFSHFKVEGRGLGSAMLLEFLLYYLTKPEYRIHVREEIYLDCMLDLF